MNVVDSSGWLEYFAGGENAPFFAPAIENTEELVVPTLSLYEVFKRVTQQRTENEAFLAISAMQQGNVVGLDAGAAIRAARVSIRHRLPMADSIMLDAANTHEATLWTQDSHFEGVEGVRYCPNRP